MNNKKVSLKTTEEIKRIRESGRILAKLFDVITGMSIVDMSTWELDSFIDDFILKRKGRAAFKTIKNYDFASCISINSEIVHGIPKKNCIIKTIHRDTSNQNS